MTMASNSNLAEDLERLARLVAHIDEFGRMAYPLALWEDCSDEDEVNRQVLIDNQYRLLDWLGFYCRSVRSAPSPESRHVEIWAQVLVKLALAIEHLEQLDDCHKRGSHPSLKHPLRLEELCDVLTQLYRAIDGDVPPVKAQLAHMEGLKLLIEALVHGLEKIE